MRLLSVDARSFGSDRAALADVIAGAGVDVVCVHGGPHLLRWRSICAALARRAGLVVVTGGRTAGANLLLSTLGVDVTAVRDVRLPGGSAGAALAALRLRGADVLVVSATLVCNSADRVVQARELQAAIGALVPGNPPVIVSAEGSDRPGTAAWQVLVDERVGVAGRLFVDGRLGVLSAEELPGRNPTTGVLLDVDLVTTTR
jgi:hypothetical protein